MSCEGYRGKLSDALLRDEVALNETVAAHLRVCADCVEFYEAQKRLLGVMDAGLRAMVNANVPGSLLPRVKAQIATQDTERSPLPWRIAAVAVVGVLAIIASPLLRNRVSTRNVNPVVVAESHPGHDASTAATVALSPLQTHVSMRPSAPRRTRAKAKSWEPEVLIDPAEARGLRQLAKAVTVDAEWALAMSRRGELLVLPDESIQPHKFSDPDSKALERVQ